MLLPGELTTAAYFDMAFGSSGVGIVLGGKVTNSKDDFFCRLSSGGDNWQTCPTTLQAKTGDLMDGNGAGLLIAVESENSDTFYALRIEYQGYTPVSAVVKVSFSNSGAFEVLHVFETADDVNFDPTLEVKGPNMWVGRGDGKVLYSHDSGLTWDSATLTEDSKVEVNCIKFVSELRGFAGGGRIEEEPGSIGGTTKEVIKPQGGIWKTEDAGKSWSPLIESQSFSLSLVGETSSGSLFYAVKDTHSLNTNDKQKAYVLYVATDGNPANGVKVAATATSGRTFDSNESGGFDIIGDTVWIAGVCTDMKQCIFVSHDGGTQWEEVFVPEFGQMWKPSKIMMADSQTVYAGSSNTMFMKYSDGEGETPDGGDDSDIAEVSDEDVVKDDSSSVDDSSSDDSDIVTGDTALQVDADNASSGNAEGCSCTVIF